MTATLPRPTVPEARPASPRAVLTVILTSYLLIILDVSIVITALPEIQADLGFADAQLSWVQNAYALAFGGFLLLGARAGDLLGRRRMFITGFSVFVAASALGTAALSPEMLLGARLLQGLGAAIATPATLALLIVTFEEGPARTRAVSWYAAAASGGGSLGLVVGGMLTTWVSWRLGMAINVPLGLAMLWFAPRVLQETPRRAGHFDIAGAVLSTTGMTSLVYAFVSAAQRGFGDPVTLVAAVLAVTLLVSFVRVERRAEQPITPLHLFKSRRRSGALLGRMFVVSGMMSVFFFMSQFMQEVHGYSALEAGLAFLPMTLVLFATTQILPRLLARVEETTVLVVGLAIAASSLLAIADVGPATAYFPGIGLPLVTLGLGMGLAFAPLTSVAMIGVPTAEAGAASGLVNAAHQLGGSLGLAGMVSVYAAAVGPGAAGHAAGTDAVLHVAAGLLAIGLVIIATVVVPDARRERAAQRSVEAAFAE
ncbi:MAG: MFS transporter [Solirubrobacteraceae bacterium]|nr:MFS transporter [Solirubrobacteraceae bacterium]